MYFRFTCPHCSKNLKVRPEHAGRRVGCPYCNTTITIPLQPQAPSEIEDIQEFVEESSPQAAGPPVPDARRQTQPEQAASNEWEDGTNVSMLVSCVIGLVIVVVFYLLVWPISDTYFGKLFFKTEAGWWVPPVLMFLMGWALAMLLLKQRKLARQKKSMLFDLLPTELARDITVNHVDRMTSHIRSLPVKPGESFLVNRVLRGLEHFRVRKSAPEAATILASQSDIDANAVDSSYTLLKVFIWAIPILGFIGTVVGISAAVGGFSGTLEKADDISVLKDSLNNVTGGLATAFDTTLVALVMSMLVMFPTSSMQKSEEDLLNWVDEYCNENLLKRLDDGRDGISDRGGMSNATIKQAIDASMAAHHAELRSWNKKLEAIGQSLTNQIVHGWESVQQPLQDQQKQNAVHLQGLQQMAGQFQDKLAEMTVQTEIAQQRASENMRESAEAINGYIADLERGLRGLSDVLAELGQQQIIVQQQPRRGWFFGGRRNGGK